MCANCKLPLSSTCPSRLSLKDNNAPSNVLRSLRYLSRTRRFVLPTGQRALHLFIVSGPVTKAASCVLSSLRTSSRMRPIFVLPSGVPSVNDQGRASHERGRIAQHEQHRAAIFFWRRQALHHILALPKLFQMRLVFEVLLHHLRIESERRGLIECWDSLPASRCFQGKGCSRGYPCCSIPWPGCGRAVRLLPSTSCIRWSADPCLQ